MSLSRVQRITQRTLARTLITLLVASLVRPAEGSAQSISNHPGVLLSATAGHTSYRDDSSSAGRRQFRLRGAYRLCIKCATLGDRFRVLPFVSLAVTDLAGLSHTGRDAAAISSLDAGVAGSFDVTRAWRIEVAAALGLRSTAERLTTRSTTAGPVRDFVNLSGSGAPRFSLQVERACVALPIAGRRSLIGGLSSARGHYNAYEIEGVTSSLPQRTNHRSTSVWIGVQSRLLLSDCGL